MCPAHTYFVESRYCHNEKDLHGVEGQHFRKMVWVAIPISVMAISACDELLKPRYPLQGLISAVMNNFRIRSGSCRGASDVA